MIKSFSLIKNKTLTFPIILIWLFSSACKAETPTPIQAEDRSIHEEGAGSYGAYKGYSDYLRYQEQHSDDPGFESNAHMSSTDIDRRYWQLSGEAHEILRKLKFQASVSENNKNHGDQQHYRASIQIEQALYNKYELRSKQLLALRNSAEQSGMVTTSYSQDMQQLYDERAKVYSELHFDY